MQVLSRVKSEVLEPSEIFIVFITPRAGEFVATDEPALRNSADR